MPGPLTVRRRALLFLSSALLALSSVADVSAQAKKPAARKPVAAAKPAPRQAMEITCGLPTTQERVEKKGFINKIRGEKSPKLPEACVLSRFKDPAFPVVDPNSMGASALSLFGGAGPVKADWLISQAELQKVADDIADLGPRPDLRARVYLSSQNMAEAHAVFLSPGGKDGIIVLSTRLMQSLRDLSQNTPGQTDDMTQQYLSFIIAHEYAHLVLNHPQQLNKAESVYKNIGQALQLAGVAFAIIRKIQVGPEASYSEKQREGQKAATVLLAAQFAGLIAATEGTRFLFPIFHRSVDRDADMLAVDILKRSQNRDPVTGVESLRIFRKQNEQNVKRSGAISEDAQKSVQTATALLVELAPDLARGDQTQFEGKLKLAALSLVGGYALRKLKEHEMMIDAHLHDSPEDRELLVNSYLQTFYGKDALSAAAPTVNFAAAKQAMAKAGPEASSTMIATVDFKKVGAEVDGLISTEAAQAAMARGSLAEARRQIDLSLKSPIKGTVDVQLVAGGISQAEGNHDIAIKHFRNVIAAGYRPDFVYLSISDSQSFKKDHAGALKTIAEGIAATGRLNDFILRRMEIHRDMKNEKAVQADLEACMALKDTRLTLQCQAAAEPPPPPPPAAAPGRA
jgi:hypothetical protein